MILYVNDQRIVVMLVEAEREDVADACLDPAGAHERVNFTMAAAAVFFASGNPIPPNAVFEPKLWRQQDDSAKCAITTSPGEVPE
jgi:hypothetical protein